MVRPKSFLLREEVDRMAKGDGLVVGGIHQCRSVSSQSVKLSVLRVACGFSYELTRKKTHNLLDAKRVAPIQTVTLAHDTLAYAIASRRAQR